VSGSSGSDEARVRDRLYDSYRSTHVEREPQGRGAPALRRNVIARLPADRGARILDIGCGDGALLALMREQGYREVAGIDVSPEQVERARARGLDVVRADVVAFLDSATERYDAICAIDVIEHFDKPDVVRLLELVAASLRPGGTLIAQVPNGESPFVGRYLYGDFTHGTAFTSRSVRQIATNTGFATVDVYASEPVPHGARSAVRWGAWKAIAAVLKGMLLVETGVARGHVVTQNLVFTARTPDA
jgi:2-polyprenyl-3-methyl-5-hydroxy-6-metoxy-1,4-benzoquinol methylase